MYTCSLGCVSCPRALHVRLLLHCICTFSCNKDNQLCYLINVSTFLHTGSQVLNISACYSTRWVISVYHREISVFVFVFVGEWWGMGVEWGYSFALSSLSPWLSRCRVNKVGEGEGGERGRGREQGHVVARWVRTRERERERESVGVLSRCRVVRPRPCRRKVGENEGEVRARAGTRARRPIILVVVLITRWVKEGERARTCHRVVMPYVLVLAVARGEDEGRMRACCRCRVCVGIQEAAPTGTGTGPLGAGTFPA